MNKKLTTSFVLGAAFLGLGLSVPSCPGQQAMQQQIDILQQSNADLAKKFQALDSKVSALSSDFGQGKMAMDQAAKAVASQTDAIAKLQSAITDLQSRAAPAKGGKRRR